ncbi:8-amino-7-oxononanoate synthase [Mucilaginibacter terrenus]|uniref:8-amino-7-oxononanoate synthase n=2 Tax=Mucilaginibacter terrenus TaxID=2482727 RepID=A0A3E2NYG8_9SPHI|nr:8-amino-7-oxononanoate synthase [Mucilaginibacter terrenus]
MYRILKPENNLIDVCSNDYLGFARSHKMRDAILMEVNAHVQSLNGSTGSRLLSGNTTYAEGLEKEIANWHNAEAGLLFNSGYDANIGLFSSVPQKGDTIICDELIHASIIDGARLSYANRYSFKHNDLESLEAKLKAAKGNCYVVIESVYSMDGDTPPILQIQELTAKYGANLIIDEAHAVGLYPRGLIAELGVQDKVFARVVTFGKALGCHGAMVLGSETLRNFLVNFARSFIYTTAASFHQLASVKIAYQMLTTADVLIAPLKQNIATFKNGIAESKSFPLLPSSSAIQCIVLNSNEKAREVAGALQEAGFDARPILSPTVPKGLERIRICLHSFNTTQEIQLLTSTINSLLDE